MVLNMAGKMIEATWISIKEQTHSVRFDCHVVMPNHFHALVWVQSSVAAAPVAAEDNEIPFRRGIQNEEILRLMHEFKSRTTSEYIKGVRRGEYEPFNIAVWQRSYYDQIVRKTELIQKVRNYIDHNPAKWTEDRFHPNYKERL